MFKLPRFTSVVLNVGKGERIAHAVLNQVICVQYMLAELNNVYLPANDFRIF